VLACVYRCQFMARDRDEMMIALIIANGTFEKKPGVAEVIGLSQVIVT
jgi:hypothetical protein